MKGDFSVWQFDEYDNLNGILPQQGRVVLDRDGLALTRSQLHWQRAAGRDVMGADVAAVPADQPNSFRVESAQVIGSNVHVRADPGHLWADGVLVYLAGTEPVMRTATYLQPPVQSPPAAVKTIVGGETRDAVVLEVWQEALNAFQVPEKLLEPALGGPDTAEHVHTASAFRLFRMKADQTCENLPLADDFSAKGKLTVSLQPTQVLGGDCPVVEGGGYTGFEHRLFRIEIARTKYAVPMFKWSQFNGGLVGRGTFDAKTVTIKANLPAITSCGRTKFYLEAEEFDATLGHWKVTYGAPVTLNDDQLSLPNTSTYGNIPGAAGPVFFRLWDDIRKIADFPVQASPNELDGLGIRLEFEANATGKYTPGDYWTFSLRAGGLGNSTTAIAGKDVLVCGGQPFDQRPPEGIHYHRVTLGVLEWDATLNIAPPNIRDCREVFQPLTRLAGCCTYRVGDGNHSHGDFKSIQAAVKALPAAGGEICVLPGHYIENVEIHGKKDIVIHGCGPRTKVSARAPEADANAGPAFDIHDSQRITLRALAIEAQDTGIGVRLRGKRLGLESAKKAAAAVGASTLNHIVLEDLEITAAGRSAIDCREGQYITIQRCRVVMREFAGNWPAVFFIGDDSLIERNEITTERSLKLTVVRKAGEALGTAMGGLQLGGTCMRVRVIDNLIRGGLGNGITIGSINTVVIDTGEPAGEDGSWYIDAPDPCNPCGRVTVYVPPKEGTPPTARQVSAGPLYDIRIERNRIFDMGLNGISVVRFFDLKVSQEIISVELFSILGNEIRGCLRRTLQTIPADMVDSMGYGGIALADVTDLVVWDNVIAENGLDALEPICGIFVLHGEAIDITRNHIAENGMEPGDTVDHARPGRRGGINIVFVVCPTEAASVMAASPDIASAKAYVESARAGGRFVHAKAVTAARVHENTVTVPLGPALILGALGSVSVVANQFTSRGALPHRAGQFTTLATTVLIYNLGLPTELFGTLISYKSVSLGAAISPGPPRSGIPVFPNGAVLFSNNQCLLQPEQPRQTLISSLLILTLDDVGFKDNQCLANLVSQRILTQALIFGLSLRTTDNRFEETFGRATYSAATLGIQNMTSLNQATHCLLIRGYKRVPDPDQITTNQFTIELYWRRYCADPKRDIAKNFARGDQIG